MDDHAAKARAVQILRQDAAQLDAFARDGAPLALGLGLYRGERLRQPVLAAIRSYVPPPPPPKAVEKSYRKLSVSTACRYSTPASGRLNRGPPSCW